MNKWRLQACASLALIVLTLCGCAMNYTERAMSITMDMTKKDVLDIMGPPRKNAARKAPDGVIERYSWWSPKFIGLMSFDNELLATDRVFVSFRNGKVIEWGDKYDFSDTMDKARDSQTEILKNTQNKNYQITIENMQSSPMTDPISRETQKGATKEQ